MSSYIERTGHREAELGYIRGVNFDKTCNQVISEKDCHYAWMLVMYIILFLFACIASGEAFTKGRRNAFQLQSMAIPKQND